MSGCSDSKPCPVCGGDMDVYSDYKPFDTVDMLCLNCGFRGYVKCGMLGEAERKAAFQEQGRDKGDYRKLTKQQRKKYMEDFKSLCGSELSDEEEARYLGVPYPSVNKVIIVVRGGVADVQHCPPWINVEIRDYDDESEDPVIIKEYGASMNSTRDQVKDVLKK
jgi:hypothetical protein